MSWSAMSPEFRALCAQVLTVKQLEAYRLWEDGLGYGRIGLVLGVEPSTVRDRIRVAVRKLDRALREAA